MIKIIVGLAVNATTLWLAAYFVEGMEFNIADNFIGVLVTSIIFGLINTFIKPFLTILIAVPGALLPFGIIILTFLVNGLLLWATAFLTEALTIETFIAALFGALFVSLISIGFSFVTALLGLS